MIDTFMDRLRLFVEIARHESITLGGEAIHIGQSTASTHLKTLETRLGTPLFERVGKNVCLNGNGKRFLEFAEIALREYEKMEEYIRGNDLDLPKTLTVCAGSYFNSCYLPTVFPLFARKNPHVKAEIVTKCSDEIVAAIERNEYELGVVAVSQPLRSRNLLTDFSCDIPLCFVCSPENPLSKKTSISAEDVAGEIFIWTAKTAGFRAYLKREFTRHRYRFSSDCTIDSIDAIKAAIAGNVGIGILPRHIIRGEVEENKLVALPARDLKLTRSLVGIHNAERPLSKSAQAFVDITVEVLNLHGPTTDGNGSV